MLWTEERLNDLRTRMRNDMRATLRRNGMDVAEEAWLNILVDELADDGMHQVVHVAMTGSLHE